MRIKISAEKGKHGEHMIVVYRRNVKQNSTKLGYLKKNSSVLYKENNVSFKPINNEMILEEEFHDIYSVLKNFDLFFENFDLFFENLGGI